MPKRRVETQYDNLRLPPQNLDAERGVLGSILLLNEAIDDVGEVLKADHFYSDGHQKIYAAIRDLYENNIRGIDAVTLSEELIRREHFEEIGGAGYLAEILDAVPHAAHVRYYSNIVREKSRLRRLIYACAETLESAYRLPENAETDDLVTDLENKLVTLRETTNNEQSHVRDVVPDVLQAVEDRVQTDGTTTGISTGFSDVDELTNGIHPQNLGILAARSSMGKTALVCNIAANVAVDHAVLFFSLEQSKLELTERLLAAESRIDGQNLRSGTLDSLQRDRLLSAATKVSKRNLIIDEKADRTVADIGAICRQHHRRSPLGLIIVDYIQLVIPADKRAVREQQVAAISRGLKAIAKNLNVPILALAQLNRDIEKREDKRPRPSDLRESGSLEQDADAIWLLHRPDAYDDQDRPGEAELIIGKNRNGPKGVVRLTWQKEFMRFEKSEPYEGGL